VSVELLVETLHEIAPVYPFAGVTVTEEVPELPVATVGFVADTLKDSFELDEEPTITVKLAEDEAYVVSPE
jgi:hypothetical protein